MSAALHRLVCFGLPMVLVALALAVPGTARVAAARVFLVPNGAALPGELGWLLGGAQVALVSGAESLFYNPAGLALEREAHLTLSGQALRLRTLAADGADESTADATLGSAAYATALGSGRRLPRFALGVGVAQVQDARWPLALQGARTGTAASLPPGANRTNVDADFPGGLALNETSDGLGELRVFAPALGLAVAPADWLRVGVALHLERVSLAQRNAAVTVYAGDEDGATLSGQSELAWVLAGESLRIAPTLGLQMEVTRGLVLGLSLRLPSETQDGSGRLHYQRSDTFTTGGTATSSPGSGTVFIAREGLPFHLESPRRVTLGVGFRSDRFLVELDLYQLAAQDAYAVLPGAESQPPSTRAVPLPPVSTSGASVLGYALGMAYAQTGRTSLLLGLAGDPSPVPPDDPLLRHVDFLRVSAGVYHVRGDLSGTLGVMWREGKQSGVHFAPPDGGEAAAQDVTVRELAVQAGGSVAF